MRLDDKTHQNFKVRTIQDGISIQKFIEEFVCIYLEKDTSAQELLGKLKK